MRLLPKSECRVLALTSGVVFGLMCTGCTPDNDGGGGNLEPGVRVTIRRAVSLALPEDEVRRSLAEAFTLQLSPGEVIPVGRALQGLIGDSTVYVLEDEDHSLLAFSLSGGVYQGAFSKVPEGSRIDGFAHLGGERVAGWDRRREEFWFWDSPTEKSGPIEVKLSGIPKNLVQATDTSIWVWSTVEGDYRTEALHVSAFEYSLQGELLQTVPLPPEIRHDPSFSVQTSSGSLRNFASSRLVSWSPEFGLLSGENTDYRFIVERGDTAVEVTVDSQPVSLTEMESRWWRNKAKDFSDRTPSMDYSVPGIKPAYRRVSWDDEGQIWVWRYVRGIPTDSIHAYYPAGSMPVVEPVVLDVFSRDGEYLWTVELPPRSRALHVKGDRLLLATRIANIGDREIVRMMTLSR